MSPYFRKNLVTFAKCLLAWPMTSMTGNSCRRDMGNLVAIQHLALILRPLFFVSSGFDGVRGETLTSFNASTVSASAYIHIHSLPHELLEALRRLRVT